MSVILPILPYAHWKWDISHDYQNYKHPSRLIVAVHAQFTSITRYQKQWLTGARSVSTEETGIFGWVGTPGESTVRDPALFGWDNVSKTHHYINIPAQVRDVAPSDAEVNYAIEEVMGKLDHLARLEALYKEQQKSMNSYITRA